MSDQSKKSGQATLWDSLNVTGSAGSADGLMPCVSPDGLMLGQYGPAVAPASDTLAPLEAGILRKTSGRRFNGSSLNYALARSLANRWTRRGLGSIRSPWIWRSWTTSSGRLFCRLT